MQRRQNAIVTKCRHNAFVTKCNCVKFQMQQNAQMHLGQSTTETQCNCHKMQMRLNANTCALTLL